MKYLDFITKTFFIIINIALYLILFMKYNQNEIFYLALSAMSFTLANFYYLGIITDKYRAVLAIGWTIVGIYTAYKYFTF